MKKRHSGALYRKPDRYVDVLASYADSKAFALLDHTLRDSEVLFDEYNGGILTSWHLFFLKT